MQYRYKGVPIPPCPDIKVLVTRRKGRVGSALVGGLLLGPLGLTAGALAGNHSESEWKMRKPTAAEISAWNLTWKREFEAARGNNYDLECQKQAKRVFKWIAIGFLMFFAFSCLVQLWLNSLHG